MAKKNKKINKQDREKKGRVKIEIYFLKIRLLLPTLLAVAKIRHYIPATLAQNQFPALHYITARGTFMRSNKTKKIII